MSPFAIFAIVVTITYIIYYGVNIGYKVQDMFAPYPFYKDLNVFCGTKRKSDCASNF